MELLFEAVFEFIGEIVLHIIFYGYMGLMGLIIPDKLLSPKIERRIEIAAITSTIVLGVSLVVGLILLMFPYAIVKKIGMYITFISLGLILLQITLGIISKIVQYIKDKRKNFYI